MLISILFPISLIAATLLCALVAGFLFAFAIVAMPGLGRLNDGEFIRAFQAIDGVIQNNQPLFMLVWLGSALALLLAAVTGFGQVDLAGKVILLTAVLLYLLGVQIPTVMINVPLNNQLQALEVSQMEPVAVAASRRDFEPRWNRWNNIRTAVAIAVSTLLITFLYWL